MIAELTMGLQSLNAMTELLKVLNAASTQTQINEVKLGLQEGLLAAQRALFAAQEAQTADAAVIRDLEEQIVRLKDWEAERQRYQLTAIDRGAFAYMQKPGMDGGEPPHWLCTNCFEQGKRSLLQSRGGSVRDGPHGIQTAWGCNACDGSVTVFFRRTPAEPWSGAAPPPAAGAGTIKSDYDPLGPGAH
jgi:hypothetical protein